MVTWHFMSFKTELILRAAEGTCSGLKFYDPGCPVIYR